MRKVLRSGATCFEYARAVQPRPELGAWHDDLDRMLTDVSKTCLVRFDNNKYSVNSRADGRPVEIQPMPTAS